MEIYQYRFAIKIWTDSTGALIWMLKIAIFLRALNFCTDRCFKIKTETYKRHIMP